MTRGSLRRFRRDTRAAFAVFEAIMVALLVLTAFLFFTSLQRPTAGTEVRGIDLGEVASNSLDILEERTFPDPSGPGRLNMEGWVTRVLDGDQTVADEVDDYLEEVLGRGVQYVLRIDNGVGSYPILPPDASTPHSARAAQTFLVPNWTVHPLPDGDDPIPWATPGGDLDFSTWTSLASPTTSTTGPKGDDWIDIWTAEEPDQDRVPDWVPYGVWNYTAPGACAAWCYVHIGMADGTVTERTVVALQLVVWFGA